jgi:CheY-like chemotaxis protein
MNANGAVLLVEDDPTDVYLMERSFRQTEIQQELLVVKNGVEAIEFLSHANSSTENEGSNLPRLILLDLKLPLKSGLEVLRWMREQAVIRQIPVIVFTSSLDRGDIDGAYDAGARGYFLKTGSLDTMRKLVVLWRDYWLILGQVSPALE